MAAFCLMKVMLRLV